MKMIWTESNTCELWWMLVLEVTLNFSGEMVVFKRLRKPMQPSLGLRQISLVDIIPSCP